MASINDVARLAGTSKSTVSRVLTGKTCVDPQVKERVLAVIRDLGFVPNQAARNMVLRRSFTVGIVIPDTFNMFQRQLFAHIERYLEQRGYHTDFFFEKWGTEGEPAFLRRLKSEKLDGIIVIHEVTHPSFYDYLAQAGLPTVLCTFGRPGSDLCSVQADDRRGAADAVSHLIGHGHRRIGILRGPGGGFDTLRHEGWVRALEGAGLTVRPEDQASVEAYSLDAGRAGMAELRRRSPDLTAVFAVTDDLAVGALRLLWEQGVPVPQAVSVVGFDDIDIARFLGPGLTTIGQSTEEMGRITAQTLQALIEGRTVETRKTILAHRLVVRESTGPVNTSVPS